MNAPSETPQMAAAGKGVMPAGVARYAAATRKDGTAPKRKARSAPSRPDSGGVSASQRTGQERAWMAEAARPARKKVAALVATV